VAIQSLSWDRAGRAFDCYGAWERTDRLTIDIEVGLAVGYGAAAQVERRTLLQPVAP